MIKEWWRRLTKAPPFFGYGRDIDRWRVEIKGYRFDKRFFLACILLILLLEGVGWYGVFVTGPFPPYGYVDCWASSFTPCRNKLISACHDVMAENHEVAVFLCGDLCDRDIPLCTKEWLEPGEVLEHAPPAFAQTAFGLRWTVLFWTFLLNDWVANHRWRWLKQRLRVLLRRWKR